MFNPMNEWRAWDEAVQYDLSLLKDVFKRLARSLNVNDYATHEFTKSQLLHALEAHDGFLEKRANLRALHTALRCIQTSHNIDANAIQLVKRYHKEKISWKEVYKIFIDVTRERKVIISPRSLLKTAWSEKRSKISCTPPVDKAKIREGILSKLARQFVMETFNIVIEYCIDLLLNGDQAIPWEAPMPETDRLEKKKSRTKLSRKKHASLIEMKQLEKLQLQIIVPQARNLKDNGSIVIEEQISAVQLALHPRIASANIIFIALCESNWSSEKAAYLLQKKKIRNLIQKSCTELVKRKSGQVTWNSISKLEYYQAWNMKHRKIAKETMKEYPKKQ